MTTMRAARRKINARTAQLVLLLAAGCSLQDFDYLQQGGGGSSAGGTASAGANSQSGSDTGEGGETAGSNSVAGKGGSNSSGSNSGGSNSGGSNSGGSAGKANGGTGAVGELVNPSFETSNTMGWTVDPADALSDRHAFVQPPTAGSSVPDGGYEFSTWHMTDKFVVDLHQTVTGIEDGTYVFKGYFNLGTGFNKVEAYATDCGGADPAPQAVVSNGATEWQAVSVTGIVVKGGECTVGVRIDSNPTNWLNADLFTFEPDPNGGEGGQGGQGGGAN